MIQKKRLPPKQVFPIKIGGLRFLVEHFAKNNLQAFDSKDNKVWEIKLPKIEFNEDLEADIQLVFLSELHEENNQLIAIDEREIKYVLDPKNGAILSTSTLSETEKILQGQRKLAFEIAQPQFLKEMGSNLNKYTLSKFVQVKNPEFLEQMNLKNYKLEKELNLWYMLFENNNACDAEIEIIVDLKTKKIIHLKTEWA
ncbi:MAG: hypothetical protein WCW44_04715 [archaeon]